MFFVYTYFIIGLFILWAVEVQHYYIGLANNIGVWEWKYIEIEDAFLLSIAYIIIWPMIYFVLLKEPSTDTFYENRCLCGSLCFEGRNCMEQHLHEPWLFGQNN